MENTLGAKINSYITSLTKSNPEVAELFMDLLDNLYLFRLRYFNTKKLFWVNTQEKNTLQKIRSLNINPIMRETLIKSTYKQAHEDYLKK